VKNLIKPWFRGSFRVRAFASGVIHGRAGPVSEAAQQRREAVDAPRISIPPENALSQDPHRRFHALNPRIAIGFAQAFGPHEVRQPHCAR
jgi:hypothetical protein